MIHGVMGAHDLAWLSLSRLRRATWEAKTISPQTFDRLGQWPLPPILSCRASASPPPTTFPSPSSSSPSSLLAVTWFCLLSQWLTSVKLAFLPDLVPTCQGPLKFEAMSNSSSYISPYMWQIEVLPSVKQKVGPRILLLEPTASTKSNQGCLVSVRPS